MPRVRVLPSHGGVVVEIRPKGLVNDLLAYEEARTEACKALTSTSGCSQTMHAAVRGAWCGDNFREVDPDNDPNYTLYDCYIYEVYTSNNSSDPSCFVCDIACLLSAFCPSPEGHPWPAEEEECGSPVSSAGACAPATATADSAAVTAACGTASGGVCGGLQSVSEDAAAEDAAGSDDGRGEDAGKAAAAVASAQLMAPAGLVATELVAAADERASSPSEDGSPTAALRQDAARAGPSQAFVPLKGLEDMALAAIDAGMPHLARQAVLNLASAARERITESQKQAHELQCALHI